MDPNSEPTSVQLKAPNVYSLRVLGLLAPQQTASEEKAAKGMLPRTDSDTAQAHPCQPQGLQQSQQTPICRHSSTGSFDSHRQAARWWDASTTCFGQGTPAQRTAH